MQSNSVVTLEDVYYAIPKLEGQISCQEFSENMIIKSNVKKRSPFMNKNIMKKISGDLNESHLNLKCSNTKTWNRGSGQRSLVHAILEYCCLG